ncbi:MAG: hypothetical protein WCS37_00225 [Chloroflexota bacterium]|nr:hypothetical protein [Chloroflexota bacterium]
MTQEPKSIKIPPEDLEKLVEFIRRRGKPQTMQALIRHYVESLKESKQP